jgi:arabinan endo-1,5-alpha-L-arabinosidase
MSYGFFSPDGGYEMRVFRSSKPNGPYKDATGRSAVYSSYAMNYGTGNSDTRGMKLMGAYNNWGFQTVGECAQGHNSVIAAPDGRTYLVYHTKFNNGTAGHQVRSHQLFLNKQGWLVAAPFEYNGETITDTDIATKQLVADTDIAGTYQLLVHKYRMDYEKMEEVTPVEVTLTADGNVTGAYSGTWTVDAGTSYLTIKLGNTTYNGVVIEEQMDEKNIKAIAFTATANSGVSIWGYKMAPQYALAWQLNNQKVPVSTGKTIEENIALDALWQGDPNVTLQWTSSQPAIISDHGRYNPQGLQDDTDVTLTARLSAGNYYWQQQGFRYLQTNHLI